MAKYDVSISYSTFLLNKFSLDVQFESYFRSGANYVNHPVYVNVYVYLCMVHYQVFYFFFSSSLYLRCFLNLMSFLREEGYNDTGKSNKFLRSAIINCQLSRFIKQLFLSRALA